MQLRPISRWSGEFIHGAAEAAFQAERLPETLRHARVLFVASLVLNTLFLVSDWRFLGTPHFYVAFPARIGAVLFSALCFAALRRAETFRDAERVMIAWQALTAACVGLLVTSRSDIALLVVLFLPATFFLALPTSFRWTMIGAGGCAAALLAAYSLPPPLPPTALGLALTALMAHVALCLVVIRSNRLRRQEWSATQSLRDANAELEASRTMLETMFRSVPIPIFVMRFADGTILRSNPAAHALLGSDSAGESVKNSHLLSLDRRPHRELSEQLAREGRVRDFEMTVSLQDGSRRDLLVSAATLPVGGETQVIAGCVDISGRKLAELQVWRAAHYDALTGLPNRTLVQQSLEQRLAGAVRDEGTALLLLDLDGFKEVNDTFGHDAGDRLLRSIALRLAALAEAYGATAGRLGGDELVVIVPGEAARAADVAGAVLGAVRRPVSVGGRDLAIRASIGVALHPSHAPDAAGLLKCADLALYAAKSEGRDRVVLYAPDMREAMDRRVTVRRQVAEALAAGDIVPYYQPKICLRTGAVAGFEALARWRHAERGLLPPAAFETAFEEPETAERIAAAILDAVLADIADWRSRGAEPGGPVAINLAMAQFVRPDLAGSLLARVAERSGDPRDIAVEVTEGVLLGRGASRVSDALKALSAAGMRIALDDFGTGYASLTHLKAFPIDEIKIDRSFVRTMIEERSDQAIVASVIALGQGIGLAVTAEGVESATQAEALRQLGCTLAQGYHFAKPMAGSRVPWFLREAAAARGGPRRAKA